MMTVELTLQTVLGTYDTVNTQVKGFDSTNLTLMQRHELGQAKSALENALRMLRSAQKLKDKPLQTALNVANLNIAEAARLFNSAAGKTAILLFGICTAAIGGALSQLRRPPQV